jgi:hypothetical protein
MVHISNKPTTEGEVYSAFIEGWDDGREAMLKDMTDAVARERYWQLNDALNECDELRSANERLQGTIKEITVALDDYEQDRMWAYALRRIRRIVERLAIPA